MSPWQHAPYLLALILRSLRYDDAHHLSVFDGRFLKGAPLVDPIHRKTMTGPNTFETSKSCFLPSEGACARATVGPRAWSRWFRVCEAWTAMPCTIT